VLGASVTETRLVTNAGFNNTGRHPTRKTAREVTSFFFAIVNHVLAVRFELEL